MNEKSRKKIAITVLLLSISNHAFADMTGNDLEEYMRAYENTSNTNIYNSPRDFIKNGIYMGFINGINYETNGVIFCSPKHTINNQFYNVVTNYLKAHPENLTDSAGSLVEKALSEAWPCKK